LINENVGDQHKKLEEKPHQRICRDRVVPEEEREAKKPAWVMKEGTRGGGIRWDRRRKIAKERMMKARQKKGSRGKTEGVTANSWRGNHSRLKKH